MPVRNLFLENSNQRKKKRVQFTTKDPKFLADRLVLIPTPKCMELQSLKNSATYKPAYSVSCKKKSFSGKQEYHSITMGMDIICGYTYRGYIWISQAFQKNKIIFCSQFVGVLQKHPLCSHITNWSSCLLQGTGLDYTVLWVLYKYSVLWFLVLLESHS